MAVDIVFAIMCKAPMPGASKTRLCPPLDADEAAALSGCFIADVAATATAAAALDGGQVCAVITPAGATDAFADLLPPGTGMLDQRGPDLTARLINATRDLFAAGHAGLCFVNADGPTLPAALLARAAAALRLPGDRIVIGPAIDGGYTLIGLKQPHPSLFEAIAWSTSRVLTQTLGRAAGLGVPTTILPPWYDVDDGPALKLLCAELSGGSLPLAGDGIEGAPAPRSREFLQRLLRDDSRRFACAGAGSAVSIR